MALSIGQQARWWGIGLVVFIAFLWLVSGALLPFVAGAALAYFLDPVADRLETWGLSRVTATVVITLVALVVFVLCLVILVPLIVSQTTALIQSAPQYVASLIAFLTERFPALLEEDSIVRQGLSSVQDTVREQGISMLNGVLSSSLAVVDFLMLLIVAPVVAF
ncbi:MAG TPA: AI-2E family transporter, partial [Paracoccaceae bacterium]|nr:AI-2E family transporter [Paracoccaceae bacterium]